MKKELAIAREENSSQRIRELSAEIAQLERDAQGEVPAGVSVVTFGHPDETTESVKSRGVQRAKELFDKAYAKLGLSHLLD